LSNGYIILHKHIYMAKISNSKKVARIKSYKKWAAISETMESRLRKAVKITGLKDTDILRIALKEYLDKNVPNE